MSIRDADGVILVIALLLTLMLSVLGAAFALVASSEGLIAENFRNDQEAFQAADAAAERALGDLASLSDWNLALNGSVRSTFADGEPSGTRTLADGSVLDLSVLASLANCQKTTTCSAAAMDAATTDRPWGANNPRWQLFLYGPLRDLSPGHTIDSACYIVAFIGDDPSETDDAPLHDEPLPGPGADVVVVRSQAFGPRGTKKTIELTVSRAGPGQIRVLGWRAY